MTLLTINHSTRRITGSIQHVADVSPDEYAAYVDGEVALEPLAAD